MAVVLRRRAAAAIGVIAMAIASVSCAGKPVAEADDRPIVLLISIDGFRHDYIDRHGAPTLTRLAERGALSAGLIPTFPSKTFPNHLAIVTGLRPVHHGVVSNDFYDRRRGESYTMRDRDAVCDGTWYGGEPVWVTAKRAGLGTAAFYWVGTEADIGGVRPDEWRLYDKSVLGPERVDTVLGWLGRNASERPRLVTLYFSLVDDVGHRYGPDAAETGEAVRVVDGWLERLVTGVEDLGLADRVNYVIVSDHGMRFSEPADIFRLPALEAEHHAYTTGAYVAYWFLQPQAAGPGCDRLAAAEPPARVLRGAGLVAAFGGDNPDRLPDCMVLAHPGRLVIAATQDKPYRSRGTHGYWPTDPQMHGLFLASGPHVQAQGLIPAFENVHVNPFILGLLGLAPNGPTDADSAVLAPLLRGDTD
ncbi:MAG: ectonucleotide pyrophosphatase/phosphodiesterase [Pseudomonadota bacterium]